MKLEFDSLKCVKMLIFKGLDAKNSEAIVESLADIEIRNLYSIMEIDSMLSETVKNTLAECRREFDDRIAVYEKRIELEIAEAKSSRRWMVGTIITCTLALAGYLSALIHLTH